MPYVFVVLIIIILVCKRYNDIKYNFMSIDTSYRRGLASRLPSAKRDHVRQTARVTYQNATDMLLIV